MFTSSKSLKISGLASKYLNQADRLEKLKEVANRKNYPHKIKQLESKIQTEFDFWSLKKPSPKLEDLKKDLNFIKSQVEPQIDKERIDRLMSKYGLT